MDKEIKYIALYDIPGRNLRVSSPAAISKIDYIGDSIVKAGFKLHLISPSWLYDEVKNKFFFKRSTSDLGHNKKITFSSGFSFSGKWTRFLKIFYSLLWLFFFLLRNAKKNEKIIVYHSPWLCLPILWAKRIKKFNLILEVEEIYSDVSSLHPYFDKLEIKIFKATDSFLFSTDLLVDKIANSKPNYVIYGSYSVSEILAEPEKTNKIHLLYAGIIDQIKAGAFNAIESAAFLNENYILHVIGFGEVDILKRRIEEINATSKCKIVFDGSLSGNDYIQYCQKCHIGLSTQKMEGKYLETSFPSKILSYMGMGLRVVSGQIDCVEKSKIHKEIFFYKEDFPEEIARAIQKIDVNLPYNGREAITMLDKEFIEGLRTNILR
jgi:hypothetical protein